MNGHDFSLCLTGSTGSTAMEALADDIIPINTNTTRYPSPPTSTCCAWSADLSVCLSVSRLSTRRSWAHTWETGPTEQRWWHALVRSQWPPCAAFIHLARPLWLKAFQCPMSPSPPTHTAQMLKQKMEIKRCLSCLRKSKSICYSKLCVYVCLYAPACTCVSTSFHCGGEKRLLQHLLTEPENIVHWC